MIYFIHNPDARAVKIGYTTNLKKRLKTIQAYNVSLLACLGTLPGDRIEEKRLHCLFASSRIRRSEWFAVDDYFLEAVRQLLLEQGRPSTVQDELERREGCRYGLRGVRVTLAVEPERPLVVRSSSWDRHGRLRLALCTPDMLRAEASVSPDAVAISAAVLAKRLAVEEAEIVRALAADVYLVSDWPVVCRCWCNNSQEQS